MSSAGEGSPGAVPSGDSREHAVFPIENPSPTRRPGDKTLRASGLDAPATPPSRDGASPVTFYVVRHGQTLFNVMGKVQGWCDTPLTEVGVREAEALGRGLAGVDFVMAYTSDSGRAVSTLNALLRSRAAELGEDFFWPQMKMPGRQPRPVALPFSLGTDPRLREWCYGDLEGEPGELLHAVLDAGFGVPLSFEEHNRRLPEVADVLADADCSGRAERFDAIEGRLRGFFREVGDYFCGQGGGNVLVVTHSFVVRTLVYLVDPARVNDPVKIPNVSVTQLVYDGEDFALGAVGSTKWVAG